MYESLATGGTMFKVELIIGHRHRNGAFLSQERLAAVEHQAVTVFSALVEGGHALHRTVGYLTADGKAEIEPCTILFADMESMDGALDRLWALAHQFDTLLDQAVVLLIITRVTKQRSFDGLDFPPPIKSVPKSLSAQVVPDQETHQELAVHNRPRFNPSGAAAAPAAGEGFQRLIIRLFK
jgi:hypothetical protein